MGARGGAAAEPDCLHSCLPGPVDTWARMALDAMLQGGQLPPARSRRFFGLFNESCWLLRGAQCARGPMPGEVLESLACQQAQVRLRRHERRRPSPASGAPPPPSTDSTNPALRAGATSHTRSAPAATSGDGAGATTRDAPLACELFGEDKALGPSATRGWPFEHVFEQHGVRDAQGRQQRPCAAEHQRSQEQSGRVFGWCPVPARVPGSSWCETRCVLWVAACAAAGRVDWSCRSAAVRADKSSHESHRQRAWSTWCT
eukprot:7270573-Prymnesium_polylepis.1